MAINTFNYTPRRDLTVGEANNTRSRLVALERELALPPLHQEFNLNGQKWVVSFVNQGQMRFSALWLGKVKKEENVTLNVQSTSVQPKSIIK
jgi:hypothetical protein